MATRINPDNPVLPVGPQPNKPDIEKIKADLESLRIANATKKIRVPESSTSELGKAFLDGFLNNTENTIDDQTLKKETENTINTKPIPRERKTPYNDITRQAKAQALLDQEAAKVELDRQRRLYEMQLALANEYNRNGGK